MFKLSAKPLSILFFILCGAFAILNASEAGLAENSNRLAFKLYEPISADAGNGNLVYAPFSVCQILALNYMAADGAAADEIAVAVGFARDRTKLASDFKSLFNMAVNTSENVSVKNSVWLSSTASPNEDFIKVLKENFNGELFSADFAFWGSASARIEKWISQNTLGLLGSPSAGRLPSNTTVAFVNASSFVKEWKYKFEKSRTRPGIFWTKNGELDVPFMNGDVGEGSVVYDVKNELLAVMVPYKGGQYSMVIIMPFSRREYRADPDEPSSNEKSEWRLDYNEFSRVYGMLNDAYGYRVFSLCMPKFEFSGPTVDIKGIMSAAGIEKFLGETNIDYSRLSPDLNEKFLNQVSFGEFMATATINVDEEGTRAAAVAMGFSVGCSAPDYLYANIDSPFKYFVVHNTTGLILFMGEVNDPSKQ